MSGSGYPRHMAEFRNELRAKLDERPTPMPTAPTLAHFVLTALGERSDQGKPARISGDLRDRLVELARAELAK